jgi:hypothetical protein
MSDSSKDKEKKTIIARIESKIDQFILNEKKELSKDIANKIDNYIEEEKQSILTELESSIESYLDNIENNDYVSKLDAKLDEFLSGKMPFNIDDNDDEQTKSISPENKTPKKENQSDNANQKTPEMLLKDKIERDLAALKQLVKPSSSSNLQNIPEKDTSIKTEKKHQTYSSDSKRLEKKFKDKEIDQALAALKQKYSGKKNQETHSEEPINNPEPIRDTDLNDSLNDFLKKLD